MKPEKMDEVAIQNAVKSALTNAVDFNESEIAEDRIKAQRYFDGEVDLENEDGRSAVVATKVSDTIRMVKPVLMRTFLQSDKPVEFIPRGADDVAGAEQATDYITYKFQECDGYRILSDVFHDALVKKVGIAKAYWDETEEVEFDEYSNLTQQEFQLLQMDEEAEIVEQEEVEGPVDPQTGLPTILINAKVSFTKVTGSLKVKSVPPEDFFASPDATTIQDAYLCADRAEMVVGDLVEMGYDFDEVYGLTGSGDETIDEEEDFARKGFSDEWDEETNDPSMRKLDVYEVYMRMDIEGTGVPRLYQFICGGSGYKVLDYSLADEKPYAAFEVDPEPHAFYGRSLADIIIHDQTASTSLLRGLIDNVHMSNNPRMVVNTANGNVADAMNNEIGGLLRAKGDPGSAYLPLSIPFTAGATLPALQYYDASIETKTGVSKSTLGMDANALQSTTAAGVNAAVQAGSAAAELMARNLAEGGMRQLFKLMLKLVRQHAAPQEMMRLRGTFVPVDPRSWSSTMDVVTNVGLGTGKHDERMAALQMTLQAQMGFMQAGGMGANLVSMSHIRSTLEDMLKLSGISNAERYYKPMTPEIEQQIMQQMVLQAQQAAQQGQQGMDPQVQAFMQVEGMKAQNRQQIDAGKLQVDMQKARAKFALDAKKMAMDDDRERDKMEQDAILQAAKLLGDYGIQVDDQRIRQLQGMPRGGMMNG